MPAGSAELRGLRILLVEDEFLVAMELEAMLLDLGAEVIGPVGSLDEAVAAAREETLDVGVLDVNIGGRLVTPVADALAARSIPFAFCTGYDAASLPGRHADAPILMKPCRAHDLKAAVLSSLGDRTGPRPPHGKASGSSKTGAGRARRAARRPED